MEPIKVNQKAKQNDVLQCVEDCLNRIKQNANKGIDVTELILEKHIKNDVIDLLEKQLNESKTKYTFLTLRRERNDVGRMNYFWSQPLGDGTFLFKIQIL